MKRNKTPGMDGLPIEFYQVFWDEIGELLVNAFNESFEKGQMSASERSKRAYYLDLQKREQ